MPPGLAMYARGGSVDHLRGYQHTPMGHGERPFKQDRNGIAEDIEDLLEFSTQVPHALLDEGMVARIERIEVALGTRTGHRYAIDMKEPPNPRIRV